VVATHYDADGVLEEDETETRRAPVTVVREPLGVT
jgi:hypothetical protein